MKCTAGWLIVLAACGTSGTVQTVGGTTAQGASSSAGSAGTSGGSSTASSSGATGVSSTAAASSGHGTTTSTSSAGTSASGTGATTTSSSTSSGAAVTFTLDMTGGPRRQFNPPSSPVAVSPYVYGLNGFGVSGQATKWGVLRQGGDAFTDWNWTNNFSSAGADYCWNQNPQAGGSTVAGAIVGNTDSIPTDQAKGIATIVTVPVLDFVAAPVVNNPWGGNPSGPQCPGTPTCGSDGLAVNTGNVPFACLDATCNGSSAFVANHPVKTGPLCGTGACNLDTTGPVYQDEFVSYLKTSYGSGGAPVFLMLDNEPNYWGSTHPEVYPTAPNPQSAGNGGCQTSTVSFSEVVSRDITYAQRIKQIWPQTKIFAPVVAQDGLLYAHDYSGAVAGEFLDYYLAQLAAASGDAGVPLLDVLDVHYYNSNASTPAQCMQSPRMFWDPSYTDLSAAATDAVDFGWAGVNGDFDTHWYPRQVIPRLLRKIAAAYPAGPAPGLSFSEYNSGCELQLEGAVAEADLLGIFGREGVYSATAWPLKCPSGGSCSGTGNFLLGAYDLYRNYDGASATVGDLAVSASTSDDRNTSVYAFAHSGNASQLEFVAVNKETSAVTAAVSIAHAAAFTTVGLYALAGSSPAVLSLSNSPSIACTAGSCTLTLTLPATSATTVVLR